MLNRRQLVLGSAAALMAGCAGLYSARDRSFEDRVVELSQRVGGRIGVYALNTQSNRSVGSDEDSRYAMASTFKWLLAAAVLAQVEREVLTFDQQVAVTQDDMVSYAPITSKRVEKGVITVEELCSAVVVMSDNPAANLLLDLIGGPAGLTGWLRTVGDDVTRLDRKELELNSNHPNDPRDTTTPRAMVATMQRILLGDVLTAPYRQRLIDWMVESPTGSRRIRAGLPQDWRAGDKTGTGMNGAVNNVAILWSPGGVPILTAIYMSASTQPTPTLEAAHAEIAGWIVSQLGG